MALHPTLEHPFSILICTKLVGERIEMSDHICMFVPEKEKNMVMLLLHNSFRGQSMDTLVVYFPRPSGMTESKLFLYSSNKT